MKEDCPIIAPHLERVSAVRDPCRRRSWGSAGATILCWWLFAVLPAAGTACKAAKFDEAIPTAAPAALPVPVELTAAQAALPDHAAQRPERLRTALEQARFVLAEKLAGREEALRCEETRIGDSLILTLRGRKDTYPLGRFALVDAPHAEALASAFSTLYQFFSPYLSAANDPIGFAVRVELLGSADASDSDADASTMAPPQALLLHRWTGRRAQS